MTRTDFLALTLSFGRAKLPPSSLILYHSPLWPMPALPHRIFQVPPPFSTSSASKKCFLLPSFNAPPLMPSIGWLHMLPLLSPTSALSILPFYKIHKSLIPLRQKFATRFLMDILRLLPLTLLPYAHLLSPPLRSNLGFWILKPANLPLLPCRQRMTISFKLPPLNLLNLLSTWIIYTQPWPTWPLSLLQLTTSLNPPKDGSRLLFFPLTQARVSRPHSRFVWSS